MANKNIDKAKGRAKEAAGAVSGNKRLKNEGRADQAKGSAKTPWTRSPTPSPAVSTRQDSRAVTSNSSCRSLGGGDHANHPAHHRRSPAADRWRIRLPPQPSLLNPRDAVQMAGRPPSLANVAAP